MKAFEIENYYRNVFNPKLPEDLKFRHIRYMTIDGRWIKSKRNISNLEDLREDILANGGCDIYIGNASWLHPAKIGTKNHLVKGYAVADRILLDCRLVFDIDFGHSLAMLEKARNEALKILKYNKGNPELELEEIVFTGNKGFKITYKDKSLKLPSSVHERTKYVESKRKVYISKMPKEIVFDKAITVDVMRITRLNCSINSKTGWIVTPLTEGQLNLPMVALKGLFRYPIEERPVIPKRKMMSSVLRKDLLAGKGAGPTFPPFTYSLYMTNKVLDISKRWIPILKFRKECFNESKLIKVQVLYKLGNLYLFQSDSIVYAISLKTFDKSRLIKCMKLLDIHDSYEFIKYKKVHMRITDGYDEYMIKVKDKPTYWKMIPGESIAYVSRAHLLWLRTFGIKDTYANVHGSSELQIIKSKIKNGEMGFD